MSYLIRHVTPSRPGINNSELLEPRREDREKVLGNRASFHFNWAGKKRVAYGGKKCVFRPERNVGKEGQERRAIGNEFHIVGAAKVNERRPFAEPYNNSNKPYNRIMDLCTVHNLPTWQRIHAAE